MQSLLEQLENNEAVLLMYLAGELPAEDRAEVELQLQNDGQLREQLAQLKQTHDTLSQVMNIGESQSPGRQARLVQNVTAAIMQQQADQEQVAQQAAENAPPARSWRIPSWVYPIATAAMVLIAFIAYWGFTKSDEKLARIDATSLTPPEFADVSTPDSQIDNRYIDRLEKMGIDDGDRDLLAISASGNDFSDSFRADPQ